MEISEVHLGTVWNIRIAREFAKKWWSNIFLENKALYRLFEHKYIFSNEKILNYDVVARRDLQFSYKTFFHLNSYEIIMIFLKCEGSYRHFKLFENQIFYKIVKNK
jgi:hypothetical protein